VQAILLVLIAFTGSRDSEVRGQTSEMLARLAGSFRDRTRLSPKGSAPGCWFCVFSVAQAGRPALHRAGPEAQKWEAKLLARVKPSPRPSPNGEGDYLGAGGGVLPPLALRVRPERRSLLRV